MTWSGTTKTGLEVKNLEFSLRLKIKRNDWLLADTRVRKQPIIALYFESETVIKFYNLEARALLTMNRESKNNASIRVKRKNCLRFH